MNRICLRYIKQLSLFLSTMWTAQDFGPFETFLKKSVIYLFISEFNSEIWNLIIINLISKII